MNIVKNIILLFVMFWAMKSIADESITVQCYYPNASMVFSSSKHLNFRHHTDFEGLEKNFFVKDLKNPSEVNDFVVIGKNEKRIVYSLNCKKL